MQAYILYIMQVSIYVSETDYETLSGHKPTEFRTTSMFLADILRKRAEAERVADEAQNVSKIIVGS
jgi:hypothetical protein